MPRKKTATTKVSASKSKQIKKEVETNSNPIPVKERTIIIEKVIDKKQGTDLPSMPYDIFETASKLVVSEKQKYEDASRGIRKTLQKAYKNYLMVYDQPYDPYTKRKKIFTPLTHNIVDAVSKPLKITGKAIKVQPITKESEPAAKILNMTLPYFFQQLGFESIMKDIGHRTGWLGKTVTVQDWLYEEKEIDDSSEATTALKLGFAFKEKQTGKIKKIVTDRPRIRILNLMDLYLDPTSNSLPDAIKDSSVILRNVVPLTEVQANPLYDDEAKSDLIGSTIEVPDDYGAQGLNKYSLAGFQSGEVKTQNSQELDKTDVPFVEVYERYGRIPKSWITGDKEDSLINVPGIITCATSNKGETMKTLNVRISPFGDYGPFEECDFNHLPGRWYAEGLGEMLIPLQTMQNEVVNNRRNNELLVQHRMFLYKKGKVDPSQLFARPGGGIAVTDMGDIQPLPTPDIASSAFTEDQYITSQAQAVAGIALTPVSKKMTATETKNLQANANLTYSDLQNRMEEYLERLLLNHLIPLLKKFFTEKKTIPVEMSKEELVALDTYNGYTPIETKILGDTRFLFVDSSKVFDGEFMITVDIDAGEMNRANQIQALTNAIGLGSKIENSGFNIKKAMQKLLELEGIVDERLFEDATAPVPSGVTSPAPMNGQPPIAPQMGQPLPEQLQQLPQ